MAQKQAGFFATIGRLLGFIGTIIGIAEKSVKGVEASLDDGIHMMNSVTRDVKKDFEADSKVANAKRKVRLQKAKAKAQAILEKAEAKQDES